MYMSPIGDIMLVFFFYKRHAQRDKSDFVQIDRRSIFARINFVFLHLI